MEQLEEKERVLLLANRIELLFGFCAELIPDIDLLERTANGAWENEQMSLSAAPILGAMGIDYEKANAKWQIRAKRAEALLNLIKVLDSTNKEMNKQPPAESEENKQIRESLMKRFA